MSSQDAQVNTVGCSLLPKNKINTLRPHTSAELHVQAYLPYSKVPPLLCSYEVYSQKRMLLLRCIYFRCYKTVKIYQSNTLYILLVLNIPDPKTVLGLKR